MPEVIALIAGTLLLLVLLVLGFGHRLALSRIRFRASLTRWLVIEIELDRDQPREISRGD